MLVYNWIKSAPHKILIYADFPSWTPPVAIIEIREPKSFKIFLAIIKTLVDSSKRGSPDKPPVSFLYLDFTFLLIVVLDMIKPCNLWLTVSLIIFFSSVLLKSGEILINIGWQFLSLLISFFIEIIKFLKFLSEWNFLKFAVFGDDILIAK